MKNFKTHCGWLVVFSWSCQSPETSINSVQQYPVTTKTDTVDTYFGQAVPDPYRWLEDDNSVETASWVSAQNEVTFGYLEEIPFKEKIRARMEKLWNYEKYGAPFKGGDYYFFYKNDGLQNQDVLYFRKGIDGTPEVFIDPNTLSSDGTIAISQATPSNDGKFLAYQVSASGSDWKEIRIMEIESRNLLSDAVNWVKFSFIGWFRDGFYYGRFDQPKEGGELKSSNTYHKIYYHQLRTDQAQDKLVFQNNEDAQRTFSAEVTKDERFLIISGAKGTSGNSVHLQDLSNPENPFVVAVGHFDNDHVLVGSEGNYLYFQTNLGAPNQRLVKFTMDNPGPDQWEEVIPETRNVLAASMAGGKIFGNYLVDAKTEIKQFDLDGKYESTIELPGIGTADGLTGRRDQRPLFYTFTSFTYPTTVFQYDPLTGESELLWQPEVDFNAEDFEVKQEFYQSKDGTRVPMFIVHKKGLEMDGMNPTILYGYGGFNISLKPSFSITRIVWMENGGIYAIPNIRGGGEYGEDWHEAGTKLKKQNVFDDFIAAAEYLTEKKYTSPEYLALFGGSNGGLLVGATMTQRPDLCKVALPAVGVMDMLRYQKFTIGWAWASDYGTANDSEEMFSYLLGYSPLHNLKEGASYPATLITTADHDDRVVPAHSFKFAATLQEKHQGNNPVLIRIDTKAGHGSGKPTSKVIEEYADRWAFAWYNMGVIPELAKIDM